MAIGWHEPYSMPSSQSEVVASQGAGGDRGHLTEHTADDD
jgi:hypothetical protein